VALFAEQQPAFLGLHFTCIPSCPWYRLPGVYFANRRDAIWRAMTAIVWPPYAEVFRRYLWNPRTCAHPLWAPSVILEGMRAPMETLGSIATILLRAFQTARFYACKKQISIRLCQLQGPTFARFV